MADTNNERDPEEATITSLPDKEEIRIPDEDSTIFTSTKFIGEEDTTDRVVDNSQNSTGGRLFPPPSTENKQQEGSSWRTTISSGMNAVSDMVNDNIVPFRYGTIATITLLTVYGLSRTPLFFRYNTVSDIPSTHFTARRTVHGRIVRIVENSGSGISSNSNGEVDKPIVCLVHHLSPMGRLLSRSAYEMAHRASPVGALGKRIEDNDDDLLKVEIAGIKCPPDYDAPSYSEQPGEWLRRLAETRTTVSCQLIARRHRAVHDNLANSSIVMREENDTNDYNRRSSAAKEQIAVCRLFYRPSLQLFPTDIATSLVRYGRASVLSSGMYVPSPSSLSTIDVASTRLTDLRKDATYLEKLERVQFEAIKEKNGMWSSSSVRESRKDIVDEATFQATATLFQRLWRWLKGG